MPIKIESHGATPAQVVQIIKRAQTNALRDMARFVQARAAKYPPKAPSIFLYRRTGSLGRSITYGQVQWSRGVAWIEVGTKIKYAEWVEGGTGIYGPSGRPILSKGKAFPLPIAGGAAIAEGTRGVLMTASGVRKRKGRMVRDAKRDKRLLFRRQIKGMPGWHFMKNAMADSATKTYIPQRLQAMGDEIKAGLQAA